MTVQMWYDFDWKGAAASLRRARVFAPTEADVVAAAAGLAYAFGRREETVEFARQAVSRDPVNAEMREGLGFGLDGVDRYNEAEAEFRRIIELSPAVVPALVYAMSRERPCLASRGSGAPASANPLSRS